MAQTAVGRLWRYPVKSMQGEEVDAIVVGSGGAVADRGYGFLDVETGRLVSAKRPKRFGALLNCAARFLSDPVAGGPPPPIEVRFGDGSVVRDDNAELARRVSALLGREVRLITAAPEGLALDEVSDPDEAHVVAVPVAAAAPGTMLDLAPLHILPASTLAGLAAQYPEGTWDPRRLRPNMIIDGGAADESDWYGCELHVGADVVVHVIGPTPRCVMTTLAQPGLPRDPGVLAAIAAIGRMELGSLGQFACAGVYAEVVRPGTVRRGDTVTVHRVATREAALAATITMTSAATAATHG